jgi:hypothetical protein
MRTLLLSTSLVALVAGSGANATQVIAFGQISNLNTVTGTENAGQTATTMSATNVAVEVSQFLGPGAPFTADFNLSANSVGAAFTVAGNIIQRYSGTFCISSGLGCTGTDFLSGSFIDAAFGNAGGPGLTVDVSNPTESLSLSSSVLAANLLQPPNTFDLAFSNLTPPLAIAGSSIASYTASVSGDASASAVAVDEPSSLAILAMGLLGLSWWRRRRS